LCAHGNATTIIGETDKFAYLATSRVVHQVITAPSARQIQIRGSACRAWEMCLTVLHEAHLPPLSFRTLTVRARVDAVKDIGTMQLLRRALLAANT